MIVTYFQSLPHDQLKAELSGHNRRLWDKVNNTPGAEYRAISNAVEIQLRLDEILECLRDGEEPDALQEKMPNLAELDTALAELIECGRNAKGRSEAVRLGNAWKWFDHFSGAREVGSSQSSEVRHITEGVIVLAGRLQRPPTQKELREHIGWETRFIGGKKHGGTDPLRIQEFRDKLSEAGLPWLLNHWQLKKLGIS